MICAREPWEWGWPFSYKYSSESGSYNLGVRTIALNDKSLYDGLLGKAISFILPRTMLLLENVDANGGKRALTTTTKEGSGDNEMDSQVVSLSSILNVLEGVFPPASVIIVMTTNYKHELDPALIEPVRVDRAIEFAAATDRQANYLFKNRFCEHLDEKLESLAEHLLRRWERGGPQQTYKITCKVLVILKMLVIHLPSRTGIGFWMAILRKAGKAKGTAGKDGQDIGIGSGVSVYFPLM